MDKALNERNKTKGYWGITQTVDKFYYQGSIGLSSNNSIVFKISNAFEMDIEINEEYREYGLQKLLKLIEGYEYIHTIRLTCVVLNDEFLTRLCQVLLNFSQLNEISIICTQG